MPNPFLCRDWTDSDKVNTLDACAERFLIRLMQKSDDFGIHRADVLLLKSRLFPLLPRITHTDIARWLAECERADLVRCYVATDNRKYVQVLHFGQKRKYMKSEHPPPEGQIGLPLVESKKIPRAVEVEAGVEEKRSAPEKSIPLASARALCPPVHGKKPKRELWQLLADEKALSARITDEANKTAPDKDLITILKHSRKTIRDEMKAQ